MRSGSDTMHIFSQSCLKPLVSTYLGTILHFCKFGTSEYDRRRHGDREEAYRTEVRRQIGYCCWDVIEMLWDCGQHIRSLHAVLTAIFPMCESDEQDVQTGHQNSQLFIHGFDGLIYCKGFLQYCRKVLISCFNVSECAKNSPCKCWPSRLFAGLRLGACRV